MGTSLPTSEELERLPMRAVVAYVARTTRRLSAALRGIVADDILDEPLQLVESVTKTNVLHEISQVHLIGAAERVVAAYENVSHNLESQEKVRIVFSFVHAALAAMHTIEAATNPAHAGHEMKRLVSVAIRATRPVNFLDKSAAKLALEAARKDYETLLMAYGEHSEVIIGEPIDCFKEG